MRRKISVLFQTAGADIPAAIVVFLIALPLCLGIALGSGAPLFSGIIAGIAGGIIVGQLSGSQLSVSGPAAGLTAIVATALGKLPGFEAFLLAVVIAGLLQIVFGFMKAGILGDFVPNAVIKAMLAAIGIILILKQLPHFAGYHADFEGDESFRQRDGANSFSELFRSLRNFQPLALLIGFISLAILVTWEKEFIKKSSLLKKLPAPLLVVLIAIAINQAFLYWLPQAALKEASRVSIPVASSVKGFFSFFVQPDFRQLTNPQVWLTAFTLAIVASLETLLNIEAADELDPYQRVTPTNRELKAQGIGNMVSGLLGGLPVTSVIVRTSANTQAGAKTKRSAIFHGILLLVCVGLIPGLLNLIPLSALASVLIFTGYKLAKPSLFRHFYDKGKEQLIPFLATVLAILFSDLLIGIFVGCLVALFFMVRSNFHSTVFVTRDNNHFLFRLKKDVSFLNKPIIKRKLEEVPEDAYVLIDISKADYIDRDVAEVLEDFFQHAHLKNIRVELKKSPIKDHGIVIPSTPSILSL